MGYKVEVLEKMIRTYNSNIEMFSKYTDEHSITRMHEMVAERRLVAAMIENDGEPVVPPMFHNGNVFFDSTLYSACNGVEIY